MKNFNSLTDFQQHFIKLISEKSLKEFFNLFPPFLRSDTEVYNSIVLIESNYNTAAREYRVGTITPDRFDSKKANTKAGLIAYINELSINDIYLSGKDASQREATFEEIHRKKGDDFNLNPKAAKSILRQAIAEAHFDEDETAGILNRVNCNREKANQLYWEEFEEKEGTPFQFYFINACPTQHPKSFAERVIYELISFYLDDNDEAILMETKADGQRIKFEDLPIHPVLKINQKALIKHFSKRFDIQKKSIKEFIQEDLTQLQYDYITTVFELNISKWNKRTISFLEWIIETFQHDDNDLPTFIFYFVFHMDNLHNQPNKHKNILDNLEGLTRKYPESATLISNLSPVPKNLVGDWIRDMGVDNQVIIDDLIEKLSWTLKPEKHRIFKEQGKFDMARIILFQELVMDVLDDQ